jgi:hypothetical protein
MKMLIYGFTVALLFNLSLFANHGRVIADITYDENISGGGRNVPLRLVSYYDRHIATLDFLNSQLNTIKLDGLLNGVQIQNIRDKAPVMDKDGNYSITFMYDEVTGSPNRTYTLKDLYDPVDIAKNSVLDQVQLIKNDMKILDSNISNLKVGELQTVPGGFKVEMTFDRGTDTNLKYHVDEYYDAKKKAYDVVEDQLMTIKLNGTLFGNQLTNLKLGPINEVAGGYSADITFDQVGGPSGVKYNIDEFYDSKIKSRDYIHDLMQDITVFQKIDSNDVTNVKAGAITEDAKNGKFTATLTYDNSTSSNNKYVIDSYYDPIARAVNDLNNKISSLKNTMSIDGTPISNLKIGKIQVF